MHIYFSGIGGTGIGPLALIAKEAGNKVSGSDKQPSAYTEYLIKQGINVHIGQKDDSYINNVNKKDPVEWFVYSSALPLENPNHPELVFVKNNNIKYSKRDEFLSKFLSNNKLKLLAAAGTHGKTTTTAMLVWTFKQLKIPVSYSVGAKTNFCAMGHYNKNSEYFVYECDEFDKNFLSFKPYRSIISSLDWDHHEIYKTREDYKNAFIQFINQSSKTYLYYNVSKYLNINKQDKLVCSVKQNDSITKQLSLAGQHNRDNARLCIELISDLLNIEPNKLIPILNKFPGTSRRFEQIATNIYSDYAHTPEEISATIQLAKELSNNILVIYEPLTNRRQHHMKLQYKNTFNGINQLLWLPSYLAREDNKQPILSPQQLIEKLNNPNIAKPAIKNTALYKTIKNHAQNNGIVLLLAGGGGGSLDEWARKMFAN
ncbi:MAG: UDP-N-acetylmuramate--alanine ligase [Patescibacteria group bacterium]|nr:UDP-N-acetylmuramate--alanine ligase [Patescibacteria group bacterium]